MVSPPRVTLSVVVVAVCLVGCGGGSKESVDLQSDHGRHDTYGDTGLLDQAQDQWPEDAPGDGKPDLAWDQVPDNGPVDLWTDVPGDVGDIGIMPEQQAALTLLFPLATRFEAHKAGDQAYFEAFQAEASLGVAFEGRGYGFNGEIVSLTAVTPAGITVALEMVSQSEMYMWWQMLTESPWFWDQFRNVQVSKLDVPNRNLDKTGAEPDYVDAVSGATVSSMGVVDGFWQAMDGYLKYLESNN